MILKFTFELFSACILSAPSASNGLDPLCFGLASTVSPKKQQFAQLHVVGGTSPHHRARWWQELEGRGAARGRSQHRCRRRASVSQFPPSVILVSMS